MGAFKGFRRTHLVLELLIFSFASFLIHTQGRRNGWRRRRTFSLCARSSSRHNCDGISFVFVGPTCRRRLRQKTRVDCCALVASTCVTWFGFFSGWVFLLWNEVDDEGIRRDRTNCLHYLRTGRTVPFWIPTCISCGRRRLGRPFHRQSKLKLEFGNAMPHRQTQTTCVSCQTPFEFAVASSTNSIERSNPTK